MTVIKNISIRVSNLLIVILIISLFFASCEADELIPASIKTSFDIPSTVSVDQDIELFLKTDNDFDNVEWTISDGTKYYKANSTHKFSESGKYSIEAKTYSDGFETSSVIKTVDVVYVSKNLYFNEPLFAQDIFFAENKIIIRAIKKCSESSEVTPNFIFLDKNLNLINIIDNLNEIDNELNSIIQFGDSVFAFTSNNNRLSFYQFKTTNNPIENTQLSSTYINYSSGFICKHHEGSKSFIIDYYNQSFEKLWTKSFKDENSSDSKYLFNLENKLFFLAFENNSDRLYIEKFKNPSVILNKKSVSLKALSGKREILFAFSNPINNSIYFAVYNSDFNKTSIYKLNEDCSINEIATITDRFIGSPQFCTTTGDIIVSNQNSIIKYNSNWGVIAIKKISNPNFGICQMGDNLNLIYENLPSGLIRLSYIDKHFNSVLFN